MNEVQKKLDELISLRDQMVQLVNTGKFNDAFSIDSDIVYTGKLHTVAKKYQRTLKENTIEFNGLRKQSQWLAKESQRLAKESQRVAKERQWLTSTSVKSFKHKNGVNVNDSINSIKLLISKIEEDIDLVTTELTDLIEMNKISSLCESNEFIQLFLETYLYPGEILFNDTTLDTVLVKIKSYCDWHYPGLQVNPLSKEWVDCMVAADPLYLIKHESIGVDGQIYSRENLIPDININYSVEYQRRLRLYTVRNQTFSALPQKQFGVIACCDFLNFFNINSINNYLSAFLNLLRPGGNLVCTIQIKHPCIVGTLVEQKYFNYAANLVIQKLFNNIGFEITAVQDLISDTINQKCILLIDARKPGVLATSKAHQVLGSIINK
jgi:hypothetical protein